MSDPQQEPPKRPKPGSLRDRIAAFESKSSAAPSSPPPPLRAKSGHLSSWKPQPSSPPPTSPNDNATGVGMSASDAKESIGRARGLKERMAALQGKGAFGMPAGASTPPPRPASEKPRWKPPPKVVVATAEGDEADASASPQSPMPPIHRQPPARKPSEDQPSSPPPSAEDAPAVEEGDDAEEQERQKRAAIAVRMARLGGTKIGMMAPPIAPKPIVKKSDMPPEAIASEEGKSTDEGSAVHETPLIKDDSTIQAPIITLQAEPAPPTTQDSTTQGKSPSARPPSSMPVPTAPRRTGPPQKKISAPTKTAPETQSSETVPKPNVEEVQVEAAAKEPAETTTEAGQDVTKMDVEAAEEPSPSEEVVKKVQETVEGLRAEKEEPLIEVRGPATAVQAPEEEEEEAHGDEEQSVALSKYHREEGVEPLDFTAVPAAQEESGPESIEPPVSASPPPRLDQEASDNDKTSQLQPDDPTLVEEPVAAAPEPEPELEEDEATRRKRVAERLAKMGAFNPLASASVRRSSLEVSQTASIAPEVPLRRQSTDGGKKASGSFASVGSVAPVSPRSSEILSAVSESGTIAGDASPDYSQSPQPVSADTSLEPREEPAEPAQDLPKASAEPLGNEVPDQSAGDEEINAEEDDLRTQIPSSPLSMPPRHPAPSLPPYASRPSGPTVPARAVPPPPPSTVPTATSEPMEGEDEVTSPIEEGRSDDLEDGQGSEEEVLPPPPPPQSRRPTEQDEQQPLTPPVQGLKSPITSGPSTERTSGSYFEVLDDSEGDPIDPTLHIPGRGQSPVRDTAPAQSPLRTEASSEEDFDKIRRQTIAERMAKLGGITFGGPPPPRPRPKVQGGSQEGAAEEQQSEHEGPTEEEDEQARKQRIAAKLASMGGMRLGMLPLGAGVGLPPPAPDRKDSGEYGIPSSPPAPIHPPTAPRALPPPPVQSFVQEPEEAEQDSVSTSDDGVKVEAEESEMEEVSYEEAQEPQTPPPVPSRASRQPPTSTSPLAASPPQGPQPSIPSGRPPIPTGTPVRRSSTQLSGSGVQPTYPPKRRPSDYVLVDDPSDSQSVSPPPPPPSRPTRARPARAAPPPPPPVQQEMSDSIQWELPSIPSAALNFSGNTPDLSLSWVDASTTQPFSVKAARPTSQGAPSREPSTPSRLSHVECSSEELMTIWGKVGVHVCEAAMASYEKSKKMLVGDGSYSGFIRAVLSQVPNAAPAPVPSEGDGLDYGYLIYAQNGVAVQRRAAEIMPGDIVVLVDAKLKGHKGLQSYHQHVGATEAIIGIVGEFDPRKSKIKVFQANQHVGQQTVESVSYKLEDLKSGSIKIFRVLEA